METTRELSHPAPNHISTQPKSKSLSDLLGMIPIGFFRSNWNRSPDSTPSAVPIGSFKFPPEEPPSTLNIQLDLDEVAFPESVAHKAVQTDESVSFSVSSESRASSIMTRVTTSNSGETQKSSRPVLVKQNSLSLHQSSH